VFYQHSKDATAPTTIIVDEETLKLCKITTAPADHEELTQNGVVDILEKFNSSEMNSEEIDESEDSDNWLLI
jgi:hypothetical protein